MYIALKRMLFGEERLEAGDEVPFEEGRNYNLLLRQGAIADLDERSRSEEATLQMVEGYRSRIAKLEGLLAEAHGEITALREMKGVAPAEASENDSKDAEPDSGHDDGSAVPNRTEVHAGDAVAENPDAAPGPGETEDRSKLKLSQLKEIALGLGIDAAASFKSKKEAIAAIEKAEGKE